MPSPQENYVKQIVEAIDPIGLNIYPSAASTIEDYMFQGKPAELVAAMIAAQHASIDMLSANPIHMVRSVETSGLTISMLRKNFLSEKISKQEMEIGLAFLNPLLSADEKSAKHSEMILQNIGNEPLCEIIRPPSDNENETLAVLEKAHAEYKNSGSDD